MKWCVAMIPPKSQCLPLQSSFQPAGFQLQAYFSVGNAGNATLPLWPMRRKS
jgi:hypothetical protein